MALLLARQLAALCILASILTGCSGSLSETIRYRLTVNVEVDGKLLSDSGVLQVKQSDTTPILGSMGGAGNEVTGEAVAIDLGSKGILFALLRGPQTGFGGSDRGAPAWLLFHTFANLSKSETGPLSKVRLLRDLRPRKVLDIDEIPMLVHFRDLNDPKSVVQDDPTDLGATLGAGVALREVVIEVTDESITTGIEAKLAWLKTIEGQLDGSRLHTGASFPNELNAYDFTRK